MTILAMDTWQFFIEIMQFLLPAAIVFLVTYFILKKMLDEDYKRKELKAKSKRSSELSAIKLQAYERFTILLERIRLDNLVMRMADPAKSASEFRFMLSQSIHDEFNHNISQQLYVSEQAWQMIKLSKEEALQIIAHSFSDMTETTVATDLGKAILTKLENSQSNMAEATIGFLKKELEIVF